MLHANCRCAAYSWRLPPYSGSPEPRPSKPTATCHKRKWKLRCSFWNVALQKLHCNICFSAVRKSFVPKAALQQAKNCTATLKKLRCRKVALSCRFPADFKLPRLGTHVYDLLTYTGNFQTGLFASFTSGFLHSFACVHLRFFTLF